MNKTNYRVLTMGVVFGWNLILMAPPLIEAKQFNTYGHTFPINEESLLDALQNAPQVTPETYLKGLLAQASHPKGIKNPIPAIKERIYYIDPSYIAPEDIIGPNGAYIARKGETINPLNTIKLSSSLLFLDGTKEEQIQWASEEKGSTKWVLVNGEPLKLENQLKRPIYVDLHGYYSSRFQIKHYPAIVKQEGKRLKVIEIPLLERKGL